MKTQKRFYANGLEYTIDSIAEGKRLLTEMHQFRYKLSNYGPWTQSKSKLYESKIIEKIDSKGYEFIVVEYEAMNFSLSTMTVSEPKKCLAVFWQSLK
jgi:hypothetical protein